MNSFIMFIFNTLEENLNANENEEFYHKMKYYIYITLWITPTKFAVSRKFYH